MEIQEFAARLDERLDTAAYVAVDASANGLQVGRPSHSVEHAAFAVDAAAATIEEAIEVGADVLVTHHGLVWGGLDRVTGRTYDRIARLVRGECALYVSHLPLDGHQELGNAAGLADLLELRNRQPFGDYEGQPVGQRGRLETSAALEEVQARLSESLDTGAGEVRLMPFGPDDVSEVAIVTGSGTDWLGEAAAEGADVLITGEGKQAAYHEAREAGINLVLGGHYATETFGVRALEEEVAGWDLQTTFVDHPTGL